MSSIIVKKFGGTSVGTLVRIQDVAELLINSLKNNPEDRIVAVVSAMSGVTDSLVAQFKDVQATNSAKAAKAGGNLAEYDVLLAAGEQMSAALLALALEAKGARARSFMGWQLPIMTNDVGGGAAIKHIECSEIKNCLDQGIIPVIAGFQGVSDKGRITTLGRGGTDTTAVALSVAISAKRCDIYTDVDGMLDADPRIVANNTNRIVSISYEEALEMAASGAKVMHPGAVEMGMKYEMPIKVLSTFVSIADHKSEGSRGTMIQKKEEASEQINLAESRITAIASQADQLRITLEDIENVPGVAAALFDELANNNVSAEIIVQNISKDKRYCDLTFTVAKNDRERVIAAINSIDRIAYSKLSIDEELAKVSLIGLGIKKYSLVARDMFNILADHGINVSVISSSEMKISVLINRCYMELAVNKLHQYFFPKASLSLEEIKETA